MASLSPSPVRPLPPQPRPTPPQITNPTSPSQTSYLETLKKSNHPPPVQTTTLQTSPNISLDEITIQRIRKPWELAVIVKCYGKFIGFRLFDFKIRNLWKFGTPFEIIDLGDDFFIVRFSNRKDFETATQGGPWFINGFFLAVKLWEPNFNPKTCVTQHTTIWIRLPGLPVEYYDREVLQLLGSSIGKILKIDAKTAFAERGRYARLCVEIELKEKMKTKVTFGSLTQQIQYENVQLCFHCGFLGHDVLNCKQSSDSYINGTGINLEITTTEPPRLEGKGRDESPDFQNRKQGYGPWTIAEKRKKKGRGKTCKAWGSRPKETS